jgi:hypothetical protein
MTKNLQSPGDSKRKADQYRSFDTRREQRV